MTDVRYQVAYDGDHADEHGDPEHPYLVKYQASGVRKPRAFAA